MGFRMENNSVERKRHDRRQGGKPVSSYQSTVISRWSPRTDVRGLFIQPSASGGSRIFDIYPLIFDTIFKKQSQYPNLHKFYNAIFYNVLQANISNFFRTEAKPTKPNFSGHYLSIIRVNPRHEAKPRARNGNPRFHKTGNFAKQTQFPNLQNRRKSFFLRAQASSLKSAEDPKRTQNEPITKPKRTQFKSTQSQFFYPVLPKTDSFLLFHSTIGAISSFS
jgi:hypothetical protein